MSAILFLVLFFAGLVLSVVGGIIGIVQAFQESAVWGLLYWFVPFASLVFLVKFWSQREWLRKSFFMSLGGVALIGLSMLFVEAIGLMPDYAQKTQISENTLTVDTAQAQVEKTTQE